MTIYHINTQIMRVVLFSQFIFGKDIIDMFAYGLYILVKQDGHLVSRKPYRLVPQFNVNGCLSISSLVDNNFIIQ